MRIVFDIDDTLYLERDFVWSGLRAVADWMRNHRGVDDFFDRLATDLVARSIAIPGTTVRLLSPEDNLLQVTLHAAKH